MDKLIVIAENYGIECVIIVNKADIDPLRAAEIREIYGTAGYRVFLLPNAQALFTMSGGDLYLTLYHPSGDLLRLVRALAASEGLFVRPGA